MPLESLKSRFHEFLEKDMISEATRLTDNIYNENMESFEHLIFCKEAYSKLGLVENILNCLNLLIKNDSHNAELFYERAMVYYDLGRYAHFEKSIITAIDLDRSNYTYHVPLAKYLKNRKEYYRLYTILEASYLNSPTENFKNALIHAKELLDKDNLNKNSYPVYANLDEPVKKSNEIENQTIIDMMNLFSGRENTHSRQWHDDSGKMGYVPVKEPVSFNTMKDHLLGNQTIGIYQLDMNNEVKFMAFDIDVLKYAQKQFSENKKFREFIIKSMNEISNHIKALLNPYQIYVNFEWSGSKGYHGWILLKEKMNARIAWLFVNKVVKQITIEGVPIAIEVFPKQGKINSDQLGNLIKVPLGIHLKTGEKCWFLDDDYKKIESYDSVANLKLSSSTDVINALKDWKNINIEDKKNEIKIDEKQESRDDFIPAVEKKVRLETDSEYQLILSKCFVIRQIVSKIENSFEISNTERMTLTFTLGHLSNGAEIVNLLLEKCINVGPDAFMKSNFSGNPVSCPKIRNRLATLAEKDKCKCEFSDLLNTYPNPLLHLRNLSHHNISNDLDSIKIKRIVENYIETKKEYQEIQKTINNLENSICNYFEQAGITEIDTSFGTLCLISENNKKNLILKF
jgi:hypothetical protein